MIKFKYIYIKLLLYLQTIIIQLMKKIEQLLNEYGESHQTKLNKMIHYFCVPAIFFSLIGLLASIPISNSIEQLLPYYLSPYLHYGTLVSIIGLIYYLRLSITLCIGMLIFSALVLLGIHQLEVLNFAPLWLIMACIFIFAWVLQFIGHNHEGKKPSFIKDLQFLMIGPAWTMSHIFEALNIKY